jgi:hypothetical protein
VRLFASTTTSPLTHVVNMVLRVRAGAGVWCLVSGVWCLVSGGWWQRAEMASDVKFTRVLGGSGSSSGGASSAVRSQRPRGAAAAAEAAEWSYRDAQGAQQGPFTLSQMQQWYAGGYLPDSTQVRHVDDADFVSIGQQSRIYTAADQIRAVVGSADTGGAAQPDSRNSWRQQPGWQYQPQIHPSGIGAAAAPGGRGVRAVGSRAAQEANERLGLVSEPSQEKCAGLCGEGGGGGVGLERGGGEPYAGRLCLQPVVWLPARAEPREHAAHPAGRAWTRGISVALSDRTRAGWKCATGGRHAAAIRRPVCAQVRRHGATRQEGQEEEEG